MDDSTGGPCGPEQQAGTIWVVAAAVVDDLERPSRLLAARRTEPPLLAGGWELPGGKIDPGESAAEALHREIAEELGVRVELGPELAGVDGAPGWPLSPPYRMRVWLARVVSGEPAPIEDHDCVVWLETGRWLELGWLPSNLAVLRALITRFHPPVYPSDDGQGPR